ncbi:MAG: DUF1801 domain-containing protein [Bacteroidia bacterium]
MTKQPVKKTAAKKSKLAEIKTKQTSASVEDFVGSVKDEQKQKDSIVLLQMMKRASGEEPKMWGVSLLGFGSKIYKSPTSGREVNWFLIGFSPRKANLSVYLMINHKDHAATIKKLGKHKTAGGCIYINKLEDIDLKVLKSLIEASLKQ